METRLDVISADKNRTYVIFVCGKHNPSHQSGGNINPCPFYASPFTFSTKKDSPYPSSLL